MDAEFGGIKWDNTVPPGELQSTSRPEEKILRQRREQYSLYRNFDGLVTTGYGHRYSAYLVDLTLAALATGDLLRVHQF
jgi:hypothetical protein